MRPLLGIGYKVLSVTLFVVMMIFIKLLSDDVPIGQIIFLRALIGLAAIMLAYRLAGRFQGTFRFNSKRKHLNWSLAAATAMCCWFVSITLIPLPEATAISFVMPLITVALAWLILGEHIRTFRWMAVFVGLLGVCIIIWPRLDFIGDGYNSRSAIGAGLALCAAGLWALAQIFMRRLMATETSGSAVFSFSIATTIIALFTLPLGWVVPTPGQWLLMAGCGLAGGAGQFFVAESLRHGEASTIATFEYLNFPVASIAAALIFSEYPDSNVWLGLPFVVAAGLFVIFRERQLAKRASERSGRVGAG